MGRWGGGGCAMLENITNKQTFGMYLNNSCWFTDNSSRQVSYSAIMRPPRLNLKLKCEIYYGIEFNFSRCAGKIKIYAMSSC